MPATWRSFTTATFRIPAFFEVAKRANIYLSLALLVVLGVIFFRELPGLAATNLTGILAFGIFVFKAGYAQSELLFYFLMFVTFLGCWHLLRWPCGWRARSPSPPARERRRDSRT